MDTPPFPLNTTFKYNSWDDVRHLVRTTEQVEPTEIIETVEKRFAMLHQLTELEQQVIVDASSGWNEPLAERLRAEINNLATERYFI